MSGGDIITAVLTWIWNGMLWIKTHMATWITPFMQGKGWGSATGVVAWILTVLVIWFVFKLIFGRRR